MTVAYFRLGNNAQETASNKPASAATAFNLGGAEDGRQTLVAAIGTGNSGTFIAQQVDANNNPATSGAWQIFVGTVTDAATDTLSQTTIIASSAGGAAIDWSATGVDSFALITAVAEESRLPRRTQSIAFAGESSYDVILRAGCEYQIMFSAIDLSNDNVGINMRVSTDGTTFDSGAGNYTHGSIYSLTSATPGSAGSTSATEMQLWSAFFGNADAKEEISGYIWVQGAGDASAYTRYNGQLRSAIYSTNVEYIVICSGGRLAAQADVALRIYPSAGTFDAGRLSVWEYPVA